MKRDPRCKFSIHEEQEIIKLYAEGLCLSQVGNKFNTSLSTVHKILKEYNIDRRSHGEGTRLLYKHLEVEPPKDFPQHLQCSFPKLLAVFLLTDGYMKKGGGIMLISTDEILQKYFLSLVKKAYGFAPTTNSFMKKGKETIVWSKSVTSKLLELSPNFKTYPRNCSLECYCQSPQPSLSFLENEDLDVLKEAVRIAMSTDGTVNVDFPRNSIYPKLEFSCAHPVLIYGWKQIFERIGIKSFFIKSKVTWSGIRGLGVKELRSIKHFIELGGFIDGVKITGKSKYYKGITKNELLNLVFSMNKNSFQFPEGLGVKKKHRILREMITDPTKREEWLKIGVYYPAIKKKLEKERIRQNILNFVKKEVSTGRFPTYNILKDKFKINVQHHFKGGMKEIYKCCQVKTRKEHMCDKITDFVKKSTELGYYPTGEEIDRTLHTNFREHFISVADLYKKAGVRYPRIAKRKPKKPFKTKEEGREAIKKYLLEKIDEGSYPSSNQIEDDVRVKLSTYFRGTEEAYNCANIKRNS